MACNDQKHYQETGPVQIVLWILFTLPHFYVDYFSLNSAHWPNVTSAGLFTLSQTLQQKPGAGLYECSWSFESNLDVTACSLGVYRILDVLDKNYLV